MGFLRLAFCVCLLCVQPCAALAEDMDDALLERVGRVLKPKGKINKLASLLGKPADESRDLGFRCAWHRFALQGEALKAHVDVVTWRDWVAGVRVSAPWGTAEMTSRIRKAWGKDVRLRDAGYELRAENAKEMARLRRAIGKGLGLEPTVHRGLGRKEVHALSDPLAAWRFGTACRDGDPPARKHARALWLGGSFDLAEIVLASPNPEGRVYAAEVLLQLGLETRPDGLLHQNYLDKVASVLTLDVPIRCCEGDQVLDRKAAALVSEESVRKSVLCRVLVREKDHMDRLFFAMWVFVYPDGRCSAERVAPAGLGMPRFHRAELPEALLRRLQVTVKAGAGSEMRHGIRTYTSSSPDRTDVPEAIRELLAELPDNMQ